MDFEFGIGMFWFSVVVIVFYICVIIKAGPVIKEREDEAIYKLFLITMVELLLVFVGVAFFSLFNYVVMKYY